MSDLFGQFSGISSIDTLSDDFEKEMNDELEERLSFSKGAYFANHITKSKSFIKEDQNDDSDSNSNDALFYDPNADDADAAWINDIRNNTVYSQLINKKMKINSDAVLNCPCCMVQLCIDCQRHVKHHNQYRAMFVQNCLIDFTQKLEYKEKRKKWRKENEPKIEVYHPVKCEVCGTQVAVYDKDEVYHFFNVLSSFPS